MKRSRTSGSRRPTTNRLLLIVALILICGLVWGLTAALADSSSPAPGAGKVVLKIGWTSEPDNLNPFVGWATTTYEIWTINYNFLFGFDGQSMRPSFPPARTAACRPTARSGPSTCAPASSGLTASRSPRPTSPSPTTTSSRTTWPTWR
jgi:hypothetical protein